MNVEIVEVREATPALAAAFDCLMPQLSGSSVRVGLRELAEIVAAPSTTLFVAREPVGAMIVGTVTLVTLRIPSGFRGRIESLVVDRGVRGQGVGLALCRAALTKARSIGVDAVDLTSSHSRESANGLYRKLGFVLRATNVYRYSLSAPAGERLSSPPPSSRT